MRKKSRWFLGAACAAMIVAFARLLPGVHIGDGVADFSTGLSVALLLGVLLTWNKGRAAGS
jgi:hypothetical protein